MATSVRARLRRVVAACMSVALVTSGLIAAQTVVAPAANAASQNGFVFNDPWTLTGASSQTQYSATSPAHNSATSVLPTAHGAISIDAQFVPNSDRNPGASYLTTGTNQASYGGTASMFVGAPTPSNLPALGLLTNASQGCGGGLGTQAHQNFDGVCNVGSLTVTFSEPVTDMVMDVSGLGGTAYRSVGADGRGSFNSTTWTVTSPGVTLSPVQSGGTNLQSDGSTLQVIDRNTTARCDQRPVDRPGTAFQSPQQETAGCGSVIIVGTYTSVTFEIGSMATPFSSFPTATYGTGTGFFRNSPPYADGINGLNMTPSEAAYLSGSPTGNQNADLQRVSFRLAETGEIGDTVWRDLDRDGAQDAGEPGVAGVTVTLTDADGNPVTDANGDPVTTTTDADGRYRFTGLPFGDYRVQFSNFPDGLVPTEQNAGGDDAADSDIDASGLSDVVRIDSATPQNLTADAGLVEPLGSIGDRVWQDVDRDGVQDDGEPGIEGATVILYDADGNEVARTTTDADGGYLFEDLPLGDYTIGVEDLPAGATFTEQGAGDDTGADSDVDPATGRSSTISLTSSNRDRRDVDAGVLVPVGSIGDTVWSDDDRDGVQDDGEPGVEGVTVILYDADGNEVARTTTDADGHYLFEDLPLGDYTVEFTDLPTGTSLTQQGAGDDDTADSDADPATGRTGTISLTVDEPDRTDVDAGLLPPLGSIGDRVWRDVDGDGVQGEGEPGVEGVTVILYDGDGNEVARTTTDADGAYAFDELPMGDYSVEFADVPDGFALTRQGQGDDPAADSDADPSTGRTGTVTLTPETPDVTDVDAGLVRLGSIGDRVWKDLDGDGVQDEGEPGVGGVTVILYDADGNEVARTTTDDSGAYVFEDVPVGDYTVEFTDLPDDMRFTEPGQSDSATDSDADPATGRSGTISVTDDVPDVRNVDAGLVQLGSIGDRVWLDEDRDGIQGDDEPGVEGVTVILYDADGNEVARTTTDADGAYLFEGLELGDYTVGFDDLPTAATISPQGAGDDAEADSDVDPETSRTAAISLTNDAPHRRDIDAGILPPLGSIGDRVWMDLDGDGVQGDDEPGVSGITVVLYDGDGNEVARTTTDEDGAYLFDELPMGDYQVAFEDLPADLRLTQQGAGDAATDSDADPATGRTGTITLTPEAKDVTDVDAGVVQLGSIGDRVWRDLDDDGVQGDDEPGVEGVTVILYDADGNEVARTTTDADGAYVFEGLELGDYTVEFTDLPEGLALTQQGAGDDDAADSDADPSTGRTAPVSLTHDAPHRTDVDAGLVQLGSIGDRVWRDANGDGIQDDGEPGVEGVTVILYDADGNEVARTTTDADGAYRFDDLPMGDYTVEFTDLPEDLAFSPQGAGDDSAADSDANPSTGRTGTVSLTNDAPEATDVDAGLQPVGSIGDRVWRDLDDDGIQDDGEPGVEGVTVVLYDADGNEVARTVTDEDGAYVFEQLPLGDYSIGFEDLPEGLAFSPQGAGDDPATDSDADPSTGRSGTVSLTEDALHVTDVDAGLVQLGSIGDRVWLDRDRDGIQDDGEPGVEGVTVILYDGDGNEVARTTTDEDGRYLFEGLPMGAYSVGFEGLPTGATFSPQGAGDDAAADSDADPATGRTGPIVLTNDAPSVRDVDAGVLPPLGSIGSRVWDDRDGDGVQDSGEPGVPGVTVILYDAEGNEVARTRTDANGDYLFTDLPMGDYELEFRDIPAGYEFTRAGVGGADSDSNVDPRTGRVRVTLTPEDPDQLHVDAGIVRIEVAPTPTPTPTPGPDADGGLPATGGDGGLLAIMALLATLVIAAGAVTARRRRDAA